jgi:hypothetical protein
MPLAKPTDIPRWASLTAWQPATYYTVGERVENDTPDRVYTCTTAGTSAGAGGPTGVGAGIADGTCVWDYVLTLAPAWAGTTAYALGEQVTNGANMYLCITAGTSAGAGGPTGTGTDIADGTVVWTYLSAATAVRTQPSAGEMDVGWLTGQKPSAQYFNWNKWAVYRWVLWLRDIEQMALTWVNTHVFNGLSGDGNPCLDHTTSPTDRKLTQRMTLDGSQKARVYASNNGWYEITVNAYWDPAGGPADWKPDNAAAPALKFIMTGTNYLLYHHAAAADWTDASWSTVGGASLDATVGDFAAARDIDAGRDVIAANDVTATAGDVEASAGQVRAAGTVAGKTGPAMIHGARLYGTGTTLNAGGSDFTLGVGWGDAATAVVTGTDLAWTLEITANGAGLAVDPTIVLTFKDLTWTTFPVVLFLFVWTDDVAPNITIYNSTMEHSATIGTTTSWTFRTATLLPAAGKKYRFHGMAVGI